MKPGKDYIGVGVGVMIFNEVGELLLLKRGREVRNERGCWELPGGMVQFGEKMADAAVREAKEEAGLDIAIEKQMTTIDHLIPNEGQHWVSAMFVGRARPGQTPKIMEPHKCDDLGWFSLTELPSPLSIAARLKIDFYRQENRSV